MGKCSSVDNKVHRDRWILKSNCLKKKKKSNRQLLHSVKATRGQTEEGRGVLERRGGLGHVADPGRQQEAILDYLCEKPHTR